MRDPTHTGPGGRAWTVAARADSPPAPAFLGAYLAHIPGAHRFWSWYVFSLVHLRPTEGVPAATLHYPEAEFELVILALNPGEDPDNHRAFDPDDGIPTGKDTLTPANVVAQFHGVTDENAVALVDRLVQATVRGIISPDSDYRRAWREAVRRQVEILKVKPTLDV